MTNCNVLQEGNRPEDHSHCKKQTPLETRRREIIEDPQYQSEATDSEREAATTRARRDGNTRPLGGGAAKKL